MRLDWSAALLSLCSAHVTLSHARTRVIIFSMVCVSSGGSIELNPAVYLVTVTFISYWKNKRLLYFQVLHRNITK